ncbi:MAG: hypothetical protein ACREUE_19895, partial [Panacagrimonas sp.]
EQNIMSIPGRTHAFSFGWPFAILGWTCLLILLSSPMPAQATPELVPWVSTLESPSLGGPRSSTAAAYTAIPQGDDAYRVTTRFTGHDGQAMRIDFDLDRATASESMRGYGFSQDEVNTLKAQCRHNGGCTTETLDQLMRGYYQEHGLRVQQGPTRRMRLSVDIPHVVRRNRSAVQPIVVALRELGREQGFDLDRRLSTATALVQGGFAYRVPREMENGRRTLGFYTPPRTMEKGYGDCDTKSALLAAVLAGLGEERVIGVHVPGHYLLGVAREPRSGEASVEFGGRHYLLLEAAGPAARRPGDVAKATRAALASGQPIRIDPIF